MTSFHAVFYVSTGHKVTGIIGIDNYYVTIRTALIFSNGGTEFQG